MFTLVESIKVKGILDRPDLGCAMLIAACKKEGYDTKLINGQTNWLKQMFVHGADELWYLIHHLKVDDLSKLKLQNYKQHIDKIGFDEFKRQLRNIYQKVIVENDPRVFLHAVESEQIINLTERFFSLYEFFLKELDYDNLSIIDHYFDEIIATQPKFIGFSLKDKGDIISKRIRKRLKEQTNIPIIAGGSFTPFMNQKRKANLLKNGYIDYLIIGEGELALPKLLKSLELNKEPKDIFNICYKTEEGCQINEVKSIKNLDSLPYPDFSQFDLDLYLTPKRILPIQTSRGCSWQKCAFCGLSRIYDNSYKPVAVERIVGLLQHLNEKYDCSHVSFNDEELTAVRARNISRAILDNDLQNVSIHTLARFTKGYNNHELWKQLYQAGFKTFAWGLESGSQKMLELMNKGTDLQIIQEILRKSSKTGIANFCFLIIGFPGESQETIDETLQFLSINSANIDHLTMSLFHLKEEAPIFKNPEKWGVIRDSNHDYLVNGGMNKKETIQLFKKINSEIKLGLLSISSSRFKYNMNNINARMYCFLMASHNLLPGNIIIKHIKSKNTNNIFPILLGEFRESNGRYYIPKIDISKSTTFNRIVPEKRIKLTNIQKKLFILSNGKLSIQQIISTVIDKAGSENNQIESECLEFYEKMFRVNQGFGFSESWM